MVAPLQGGHRGEVQGSGAVGSISDSPSFGYGGYCLSKDIKQLLANCKDVLQSFIGVIVEAIRILKDFVGGEALKWVTGSPILALSPPLWVRVVLP